MRFDVYANESSQTRKRFPYLLVLQSEMLSGLSTVVVAPLGKPAVVEGKVAKLLLPTIEVGEVSYVMYTPELASVPHVRLKRRVANVTAQRNVIVRALDFLFDGI